MQAMQPRIAEIRDSLPKIKLYIQVEDESGNPLLDGALDYETALADSTPLPFTPSAYDDRYMLYTGGTTGMPKGVMYDNGALAHWLCIGGYTSRGLPPPTSIDEVLAGAKAITEMGACTEACRLPSNAWNGHVDWDHGCIELWRNGDHTTNPASGRGCLNAVCG